MTPDEVAIAAALHRLYAQGVLIRPQVVAVCDILGLPERAALDGDAPSRGDGAAR